MIKTFIKQLFCKKKLTGLIPEFKDSRDYKYIISGIAQKDEVDLRSKFPMITNQLNYNSCTAHAVCALLDFELRYNKKHISWDFNSSEAFLWYVSRLEEGTQDKNVGVQLRNVFKVIKKYGFVRDESWTYSNGIYNRPTTQVFIEGQMLDLYLNQLPEYYSIDGNRKEQVKDALNKNHPIVFGFPISNDFMFFSGEIFDGIINEKNGYHAMLIVGYNDTGVIVRNSWGNTWGKNGYCIIEWDDFIIYAFNIWCLQ